MNGQELPVNNGFPVRAVVPGIAGARSVKWLDRITVSDRESSNHYQHYDYKILPPDAVDKESAQKYWDKVPAMQDMQVPLHKGSSIAKFLHIVSPSRQQNPIFTPLTNLINTGFPVLCLRGSLGRLTP